MLLVIQDKRLAPDVVDWTTRALTAGVRRKAPTVAVVEHLGDEALRTAMGGQVVVIRSDTNVDRLIAAVASAAAVVFITPGQAQSVRLWLDLDTGVGWRVPIAVVIVTDEPVNDLETLAATAGVSVIRNVRPAPHRKGVRLLSRTGKSLAPYAVQPRRLDASDAAAHRAGARHQAENILKELMDAEEVEEYQIFGGGRMQVQYSDGHREDRESPFPNDYALESAIKFMATFGGDRPHRFDEQHPRLDMNLKERWRLHAEGFVVSPMYLALRANMGGRRSLAELGFADARLNDLLVGAVSGSHRANVIVAATMSGGKTTLLQALLAYTPAHERVDTIEDTPELRLAHYGIHRLTFERLTRDANADGIGKLGMADHIRDAKRGNASKLVVGEIRGEGADALFDAMSSGMYGCVASLHSPPGPGVLEKLVAYAQSEGATGTYARRQIATGVHLLVWLGRNHRNERVIADVTEIAGVDAAGMIRTNCLWQLIEGERWARPVGLPQNPVVASLYGSVGTDLEDIGEYRDRGLKVVDAGEAP
ncbi:MAG: ATPase, T2SS/T4P/T4SS family [bacterium]|nr:ATPase, T2SS/T4P/T4SS family [bacterium]MDE0289555.1 ATPase, T2SS/T4P/T4SS family [bacterium]MDE0437711.1 ATPase, T2SS/T4P/T4SS family [bacterium]